MILLRPACLCRELMDNGGFIYMPAVKVRARGKAAAGLSAGVKAGVIGGATGRSPAYQRCAEACLPL